MGISSFWPRFCRRDRGDDQLSGGRTRRNEGTQLAPSEDRSQTSADGGLARERAWVKQ